MLIAVFTSHAAKRTEPLGEFFARVHAACLIAGSEPPAIRLLCTDGPVVSMSDKGPYALDRVIKRFPSLAALRRAAPETSPPSPIPQSLLTNVADDGTAHPLEAETVEAIAAGVPRTFPFGRIAIHLAIPGFAELDALPTVPGLDLRRSLLRLGIDSFGGAFRHCGIAITDSWWATGRQRAVNAMRLIHVPDGAKKLPPPPAPIATLLEAAGKIRKTTQLPLPAGAAETAAAAGFTETDVGAELKSLLATWRTRLPELAATLPHPVPAEAPAEPTAPSGPKKPALEAVFKPMGYAIRGDTGAFTLTRRTPNNLTIELNIDVGTWSDRLLAQFRVMGIHNGTAFRAVLSLPVSPAAPQGGQFPIRTPDRWRHLVENLGAVVAALQTDLIPAIEALTGPTPAWFQPQSA